MFSIFGFFSIGSCAGLSGQKTSHTVSQNSNAGILSMRSAASSDINSDSVDEFDIDPSFSRTS